MSRHYHKIVRKYNHSIDGYLWIFMNILIIFVYIVKYLPWKISGYLENFKITRLFLNKVFYLYLLAWHYSWVIMAFENLFYRVIWAYNMLFFNTTISYEQFVWLQCVRSKVVEIKKISIPINQMAWTCRIRLFFYI